MSALVASDIRSPFSISSEISACSEGWPSPAATSSEPSSLRAATGFQVAGKASDVGAAGGEQPQPVLLTPGCVLAQV